jgi:hypothetical protein
MKTRASRARPRARPLRAVLILVSDDPAGAMAWPKEACVKATLIGHARFTAKRSKPSARGSAASACSTGRRDPRREPSVEIEPGEPHFGPRSRRRLCSSWRKASSSCASARRAHARAAGVVLRCAASASQLIATQAPRPRAAPVLAFATENRLELTWRAARRFGSAGGLVGRLPVPRE